MGKRQTANPGWARIFFDFRQEHDASAFGMWGPKNSRTTTKCDKLGQTTTKMIRKCKKFLRSCKNLHKAPGALCWVHPLRFWLQIFGLPPFGGWMKVRYGKLWQVMVRLGWKWWWKCSRKIQWLGLLIKDKKDGCLFAPAPGAEVQGERSCGGAFWTFLDDCRDCRLLGAQTGPLIISWDDERIVQDMTRDYSLPSRSSRLPSRFPRKFCWFVQRHDNLFSSSSLLFYVGLWQPPGGLHTSRAIRIVQAHPPLASGRHGLHGFSLHFSPGRCIYFETRELQRRIHQIYLQKCFY